jgi:hypothetical protein
MIGVVQAGDSPRVSTRMRMVDIVDGIVQARESPRRAPFDPVAIPIGRRAFQIVDDVVLKYPSAGSAAPNRDTADEVRSGRHDIMDNAPLDEHDVCGD